MRERTEALLAWYRTAARDLPWRRTSDPWAVLVSEVMLQQTQVARVVPAYERFIARFPDPAALAAASPAVLVELWAGLGYHRRVVNLQRAAAAISASGWPRTSEALRALPGIGPYTAAAVACFAFGEPVAAVDVNLRRVLSRWMGAPLSGVELARTAGALIDAGHPAHWNQAVMDLGATLCRPRNPVCAECPVRAWCSDPTVEVGVRGQAPYEGSVRQARAAILRRLAASGPLPPPRLADELSLPGGRVETALAALRSEGLVVEGATGFSLPGSWRGAPSPGSS